MRTDSRTSAEMRLWLLPRLAAEFLRICQMPLEAAWEGGPRARKGESQAFPSHLGIKRDCGDWAEGRP